MNVHQNYCPMCDEPLADGEVFCAACTEEINEFDNEGGAILAPNKPFQPIDFNMYSEGCHHDEDIEPDFLEGPNREIDR